MLESFDLDSYKEHLISYYYYECDNNEICKEKRKITLESRYTDEYLLEVINNTKEFITILLNQTINTNRTYIEYELFSDNHYIFTNCTGGWHPDTLLSVFSDEEDKLISLYLLKKFLGSDFKIEFDSNIEECLDDSDEDFVIGAIYYTPKLIIVGNFNSLKGKQEELQEEQLVRFLKRKK